MNHLRINRDSLVEMKDESAGIEEDRKLVDAVLASGDEQAFRELYRRHSPRLLGFVSRLLGGASSDGEDVVQESWIRASEGLRKFQWRSTFSTWLLGIGLNVVRDILRRNNGSQTFGEDQELISKRQDIENESKIDLERAIAILPDDNRLVLVLHDIEGYTHEEISARLDIPNGTTKSRLFKARRLIRERLSENKEQYNEGQ